MPFLGTFQTAVFHPGTWLALRVPAERALPALGFAECILGALFAAWLFRAWGCGWSAASAGGLQVLRGVPCLIPSPRALDAVAALDLGAARSLLYQREPASW